MSSTYTRIEWNICTNVPKGQSTDQMDMMNGSNLTRYSDTGAFDKSDIMYMNAMLEEEKKIENYIRTNDEDEIAKFRLSSSRLPIKPVIPIATKEKREANSSVARIKIKSKKRKLSSDSEPVNDHHVDVEKIKCDKEIERSPVLSDSVVSTMQNQSTSPLIVNVSKEVSNSLQELLGPYSDDDTDSKDD